MDCSASLTALSGRWSIASASADRRCRRGGGLRAAELPVLEFVDRALVGLALLLAVAVDERVRQDAVQPGLQVGALLELPERGVRLDEGLLHQVRGIRRVPRHAHRGRVQLVHERQRLLLEQGSDIRLILVASVRHRRPV